MYDQGERERALAPEAPERDNGGAKELSDEKP
jgi:hypothetical protein